MGALPVSEITPPLPRGENWNRGDNVVVDSINGQINKSPTNHDD